LIRAAADQFRLDPQRIGALGFSAGGHLAGLTATWSEFHSYPAVDQTDEQSALPDFAVLIYPVVTLSPSSEHTSTCRELIGEQSSPEMQSEWSVQTHVHEGCLPVFIAQADDDANVSPTNTQILEAACVRAGVPVEVHRFSSGGHGFGMGRAGTTTMAWPGFCRDWLSRRNVLG
jgi:acetyl esterase/lipase